MRESGSTGHSGAPGPPPGWYPDPAGSPALRWWDGAAWTPQLSGPPPARGPFGPDPGRAMRAERDAARWARVGVWVLGLSAGVLPLEARALWPSTIADVRHALHPTTTPVPAVNHWLLVFDLVGLVTLGATVTMMVWMYRAAVHARALHRPARLGAVWAILGWIVPVVNLWFPYWVVRDTLDPADAPGRGRARTWWLLYVLGIVGFNVVGAIGVAVPAVAVLGAVAGFAYGVVEARAGLGAIDAVGADHERATLAFTGGAPF